MNYLTLFTAGLVYAQALPIALHADSPLLKKASLTNLPLAFEQNIGQTDKRVDFLSRGRGYTIFLSGGNAVIRLAGSSEGSAVLRLGLVGASKPETVEGLDKLPGHSNYFNGNDPKGWRTNISQYSGVRYGGVYPGIDVTYYGHEKDLEYDFVVAPGADPSTIRVQFEGMKSMNLDANGDLILNLPDGDLRKRKPLVYQEIDGTKQLVQARYRVLGSNRIGFEVASYRRDLPLVIDPILSYRTYLGGSGQEIANDLAVDAAGNSYIVGKTYSANFPKTAGSYQNSAATTPDVFVAKINPSGTGLIYSTFIGGSGDDSAFAIEISSAGEAYILVSASEGYPVTSGAYKTTCCGAAVTKLNALGNQIVYSTFLHGYAGALAVDNSGNAYIAGGIGTSPFPTTPGGLQPLCHADDVFITKLNPAGTTAIFSTCLGGAQSETVSVIRVDSTGSIYVAGTTSSPDFPLTPGAFQSTFASIAAAYVVKVNPGGSALVYSTFFGSLTNVSDLAVSASGEVYIVGMIAGEGLPLTAGSYRSSLPPEFNHGIYGAKLNATGSSLRYSTLLISMGSSPKLAVDPTGRAYYAITAERGNPTTPDAFAIKPGDDVDVYVMRLDPTGSTLEYATYIGGPQYDGVAGMVLDQAGKVYLAGTTGSVFPTTPGALQQTIADNGNPLMTGDAFLMKIDPTLSCTYGVSPTSGSFAAHGGTGTVNISAASGCPWNAKSDSQWIQTSSSTGLGSGEANFTVTANNSVEPRTGTVWVGTANIFITQSGAACSYSVGGATGLRMDNYGGYVRIQVVAPEGCPWTTVANSSWLTTRVAFNGVGSGTRAVDIFVAPYAGDSRTGTVTIAGQTVTIVQASSGCATVSPVSQDVPAAGGNFAVSVTPNACLWHVSSMVSWITVRSGFCCGTTFPIRYDVQPNLGPPRVGVITVAGQEVTIRQAGSASTAGCTYSLDKPTLTVGATGANSSFQITTSSCPWTASSGASWVQVYPLSGTGSGAIDYTVFPNYTTTARTAHVFLGSQMATITQAPATGTPNQRFIGQLYFNFFGRIPSPSEVALQVNTLNGGLSRADLILSFYNTPEFNNGGRFIAGLYVGLLNRDAEYGGWLFQRNALSTNQVTQAQLVQNFLASAEYAQKFGAPSDPAFVQLLYRYVLLRQPSNAEVIYQSGVLQSGQLTRLQMATAFLNSTEFRIGTGPRLTSFLLHALLLLRDPTQSESYMRIGQLENNAPLRGIVEEILGSLEFASLLN